MLAGIFSGQGVQHKTMFDSFDQVEVKKFLRYSSDILNRDIFKVLDLSESELGQSKNSQIIITVFSGFLIDQWKNKGGVAFDYAAGHSIGEYAACHYADAFCYEDLLQIIQHRIYSMEKAIGVRSGYMLGIYNNSSQAVKTLLTEFDNKELTIASYNTPTFTVVAGETHILDKFLNFINKKNIKSKRLTTSLPFHTHHLAESGLEIADLLKRKNISEKVKCPIIGCFDANKKMSKDEIIESLANQIHMPVLWTDVLKKLVNNNVSKFVVFSPLVTEFQKNILQNYPELSSITVYDDYTLNLSLEILNAPNTNYIEQI